jgi:hypothetical protein
VHLQISLLQPTLAVGTALLLIVTADRTFLGLDGGIRRTLGRRSSPGKDAGAPELAGEFEHAIFHRGRLKFAGRSALCAVE